MSVGSISFDFGCFAAFFFCGFFEVWEFHVFQGVLSQKAQNPQFFRPQMPSRCRARPSTLLTWDFPPIFLLWREKVTKL